MAAVRVALRNVAAPRIALARRPGRALPAGTVGSRSVRGSARDSAPASSSSAGRGIASGQRRSAVIASAAAEEGWTVVGGNGEDQLLRSISDMGELVILVVDGTNLVNEAMKRHKCAPTAAVALGRSLIGALLMGSFKKDGEVTQISLSGSGDLGRILCIATADGKVKGMVTNPNANPTKEDGSVDVSTAVGPGTVSVVRSHPTWREPYSGMVPITSGEVAEDLARYLSDSEQQRCALAAGVTLNADGTVAAAGGYLIQALPLISDESVALLERNIKEVPPVTDLLVRGSSCSDITDYLLRDLGVSPGPDSQIPRYGPCEPEDLKLRMQRAIATLGEKEAGELLAENGGHIEVTCDFCKMTVQFDEERVKQTFAAAEADS